MKVFSLRSIRGSTCLFEFNSEFLRQQQHIQLQLCTGQGGNRVLQGGRGVVDTNQRSRHTSTAKFQYGSGEMSHFVRPCRTGEFFFLLSRFQLIRIICRRHGIYTWPKDPLTATRSNCCNSLPMNATASENIGWRPKRLIC